MTMFTFLLITCTLIGNLQWSEGNPEEAIGLEILPEALIKGHNVLTRRAEETLNLTCRVISSKHLNNHHNLPKHKLSWHLPHLIQQNSQNRVADLEYYNSRLLIVENLKESDTGDYACHARLESQPDVLLYNQTVRVNVKNKKNHCGDQHFMCPAGNCIARRFLCDGKDDCSNGADEAVFTCGEEPCSKKLWCPEEGRCIPANWCCDQYLTDNCTVKIKPTCCSQKRYNPGGYDMTDQQRFNDMGFLQTTIYTVIGCAMAFMFIVTILVIAICRVHMKRSLLSRCPTARGGRGGAGPGGPGGRGRGPGQDGPLYDLDVFLNRSTFPPESSPHSGLLVTYNINNGIQFVGRPVDPPPYCEVVACPPREGPPPPYASRENLRQEDTCSSSQPLLPRPENYGSSSGGGGSTLRITVVNTRRVDPRQVSIVAPVQGSNSVQSSSSPVQSSNPVQSSSPVQSLSPVASLSAPANAPGNGLANALPSGLVSNQESVNVLPSGLVSNQDSLNVLPCGLVSNQDSVNALPSNYPANQKSLCSVDSFTDTCENSVPSGSQLRPTISQIGDNKPTITQIGDNRPTISQLGDNKPSISQLGDNRPTISQMVDNKPTISQMVDNKPSISQLGDNRPTISQMVDNKPTISHVAGDVLEKGVELSAGVGVET